MGIDPSTARRQFQRYYGMTFNAYQRARRMGLALHEIREGESVIATQLNNGFESASGFWEAFKTVFGTPPAKSEKVKCLQARWIDTPLGAILALADDEGLHLLEFVDRRGLENEMLALRKRTKCVIVPGNNRHLETISAELKQILRRRALALLRPLDCRRLARSRKPSGRSCRQFRPARLAPMPKWQRGSANRGPRELWAAPTGAISWRWSSPATASSSADGTLCGYGGGVWRKKWLLEHERNMKNNRA